MYFEMNIKCRLMWGTCQLFVNVMICPFQTKKRGGGGVGGVTTWAAHLRERQKWNSRGVFGGVKGDHMFTFQQNKGAVSLAMQDFKRILIQGLTVSSHVAS